MTIYIGADHAGFQLKEDVKAWLEKEGHQVEDMGNLNLDPADDYPDYSFAVATKVAETGNPGILACGSAQGASMAANKVKGIRAVTAFDVESAKKTREHNDANILSLSGWNQKITDVKEIVDAWLITPFSEEERHVRRIKKITDFEK